MKELWSKISHLFEYDDGSLPEIFIENLSNDQIVEVYTRVTSESGISGEPTLWSIEESRDIPVKEVENPAHKFINNEVEGFRHGLDKLVINDVEIPKLTICVEEGGVSFDYRKGKEWGPKEVKELFEFLIIITGIAPNAKNFQAEEGSYTNPSKEFDALLQAVIITKP